MPIYKDIADHDEDTRIDMIGRSVMVLGQTVSFITDADAGKADRYLSKLQKRFPGIVIISRGDGQVKDTVFVKVGPPPTTAKIQ